MNISSVFNFFANINLQTVLNGIAVLSFVMTSITWMVNFLNHRVNFSFTIEDYRLPSDGIIQLFIYFQSNSENPVTISGISLVSESEKYPCELRSKKIRSENGIVTIATPNFPLNFSSAQGRMEWIEFKQCNDINLIPEETIDLEFYTNKNPLKRTLSIPEPGRCLPPIQNQHISN